MGVSVSPHSEVRCETPDSIPTPLRAALFPVARKVFWWGQPEEWLEDAVRFAAQVMTFGDLEDVALTLKLLGDPLFRRVLANPPPGVFDIKSWHFWHNRYKLEVPPLPTRQLEPPERLQPKDTHPISISKL